MSLTVMQQTLKRLSLGYSVTARRIHVQLAAGAIAGAIAGPPGPSFIVHVPRDSAVNVAGAASSMSLPGSGTAVHSTRNDARAPGPGDRNGNSGSSGSSGSDVPDIYDACDRYIERCKLALLNRDVQAARTIRNQATQVFENIIPGWHQALMGQFTGFYLDDAEMILGKLTIFKANRDARKPRDYVNLTRVADRVMATHETFERVISEVRSESAMAPADLSKVQLMLKQFQNIVEAPMDFEDRWEKTRPFILWATTLDAALARHVVPLLNYSVK